MPRGAVSRECHQRKQPLLIAESNFELVMVMAEQYALITWRHPAGPSRWINNIVRRLSNLACGSQPARELISVTGLRNVRWQAQQELSPTPSARLYIEREGSVDNPSGLHSFGISIGFLVGLVPRNYATDLSLHIHFYLLCNNDGSVGIACSSPLNIFIHVIPEDGPYGPKHVVTIIRA
jgi:hypothetical protein